MPIATRRGEILVAAAFFLGQALAVASAPAAEATRAAELQGHLAGIERFLPAAPGGAIDGAALARALSARVTTCDPGCDQAYSGLALMQALARPERLDALAGKLRAAGLADAADGLARWSSALARDAAARRELTAAAAAAEQTLVARGLDPSRLDALFDGSATPARAAPFAGDGRKDVLASARLAPRHNVPAPELGARVQALREEILRDQAIQKAVKSDRALKAFWIQTLTQLRHVSLSFQMRDASYTHDYVLEGPYPLEPTRLAIEKAEQFLAVARLPATARPAAAAPAADREREEALLARQRELVQKITKEPLAVYREMRARLVAQGPEAPFAEELGPVAEYLALKLQTDPAVVKLCAENAALAGFRQVAEARLRAVIAPAEGPAFPYLSTVEAIQRAVEFLDVLRRAEDPTRSPQLYHSHRYDYYGHFLKGEIPDHIMMPTLVSLGATDILKTRGVPIGFIGVNADITWVDGFYQTPYEFWVHDVNHSRRMFQFFKEKAQALGLSIDEFAALSDEFVRTRLLPVISIKKLDDDAAKNKKRLIKVLLFEILHEDALAAAPDVVKAAVLRPPNLITPFEAMAGLAVSYVMEPGATTLAYVFRKLAHDFYDMPGQRVDNIVAPDYRRRERIVEAAQTLFQALGFEASRDVLEYFVSTDQGFPKDFKQTIAKDIQARPGETVPLDQEAVLSRDHVRAIVAGLFHQAWQLNSGYRERWKPAQAIFKDGRGINDGYAVSTQAELDEYLDERQVPRDLRRSYAFRPDPATGRTRLYEDIQHLPHQFLAPNDQFENIQGASLAVDLIESIAEQKRHFSTVEEAMEWLTAACRSMNRAWLRRNASWAKRDPVYDREWDDLPPIRQQNGVNLLKIALETEVQLDPQFIAGSQKALIQEALRRLELQIKKRGDREVRVFLAGERIHENWQRRSGHPERWKPAAAKLLDGLAVTDERTLSAYLEERGVPEPLRRFFAFRPRAVTGAVVLHEDIQNLPYRYLAANHQRENLLAGETAVDIVDRLWDKRLRFPNEDAAQRWLKAACRAVHQAVLDRNANGARDNPVYNRRWDELPPVNRRNDLDHVRLAFEARLSFNPGQIDEAQRELVTRAIARLEATLDAEPTR